MCLSTAINQHRHEKAVRSRLYEKFKTQYVASIAGKNCYMFGVPKTDDIKRKISQTRKRNGTSVGERNPMFGKQHSETSKQEMSKNRKGKTIGKKNGMYGKKRLDLSQRNTETNVRYPICQYTIDDELVAVHAHARAAADALGIKNHRNLNNIAKNSDRFPNRTAYGYKWRYKPSDFRAL
jgi:hypothetical protein